MKIILSIFTIFCCQILTSQTITGKIISKQGNEPIAYARIGIENKNYGTIADENGNYTFDFSKIDKNSNLVVNIGGYEEFSISVGNFLQNRNHNILLDEKVREIEEVKINPKKFVTKHWGIDSKSRKILFATYPDRKPEKTEQSRELAIKFSNKKKIKIQKLNFNIDEFNADIPVKIRFNIYNEKNGLPNQSILNKDIVAILTMSYFITS